MERTVIIIAIIIIIIALILFSSLLLFLLSLSKLNLPMECEFHWIMNSIYVIIFSIDLAVLLAGVNFGLIFYSI